MKIRPACWIRFCDLFVLSSCADLQSMDVLPQTFRHDNNQRLCDVNGVSAGACTVGNAITAFRIIVAPA